MVLVLVVAQICTSVSLAIHSHVSANNVRALLSMLVILMLFVMVIVVKMEIILMKIGECDGGDDIGDTRKQKQD